LLTATISSPFAFRLVILCSAMHLAPIPADLGRRPRPCFKWPRHFVHFLLAFPPTTYMHSSSPPFVLYALSISSSLTWSF
jgi:hypothetical protein